VKTHVENIYKKLGASTRAEAVTLAESAGLLPVSDRARDSSARPSRLKTPVQDIERKPT
jgi:hypothetical protein